MTQAIRYEKGQDQIVVLTIDMPGQSANTMNAVYGEAMATCVAQLVAEKDSIAGVNAGLAAGMTVLGFAGGSHCRPGHSQTLLALGAHAVFDDMSQLPELIEKYGYAGAREALSLSR